MKIKRNKIDFNSIRTVSLLYFILFAVLLILMIWLLLGFAINNYYEQMKVSETRESAARLARRYGISDRAFDIAAKQISIEDGVYIRLDTPEYTKSYTAGSYMQSTGSTYDYEISSAKEKLENSNLSSVSIMSQESNSELYRLIHATYIHGRNSEEVLYIVAPLYPVQSTVSILRNQLKVISIFSLFIAVIIALYMSGRLSAPIDNITKSAVGLSQGNYNVKFNGGAFTETNELARTLNTASYEMQRSDSYQRDLIANVTHDLKTPLTMIKSYAEMINDISGDNPVKRKEHLQVIISEADRLNQLVSDMLTMSRLQSNTSSMKKQRFDINAAASEVAATYQILNESEGYDIRLSRPKGKIYVYGDINMIKQVMVNFISNAVKYCGDNKTIEISLKRSLSNRKIRFDVVDHGIGIPSDEIGHVWDRYYRTSANHKQSIEGNGLGLSIVKGILVLHNANYGVESKEGEGSDFWFELDISRKV